MMKPYRVVKESDGWAVIHSGTGDVVVIAAQTQKGLTEISATATCNALNNFAQAGRLSEREAQSLMRGRPAPAFHIPPKTDGE